MDGSLRLWPARPPFGERKTSYTACCIFGTKHISLFGWETDTRATLSNDATNQGARDPPHLALERIDAMLTFEHLCSI